MTRRKKSSKPVEWQNAADIKKRVELLIKNIDDLSWIEPDNITCFRSYSSTARAYARIWGLNKVWQLALKKEPHYVIEILSEKFDHLPQSQKDKILLHEIAHIPKTFSGALLPHTRRGKGSFHDRLERMESLYDRIKI